MLQFPSFPEVSSVLRRSLLAKLCLSSPKLVLHASPVRLVTAAKYMAHETASRLLNSRRCVLASVSPFTRCMNLRAVG